MRIALYYPWIYLTSGSERVILEITGASRHDWTLFTNHFNPAQTYPGFSDRRVVELDRVSVVRTISNVGRAGWTIARQRLPLEGYDALFVVCEGLGDLTVFRKGNVPAVCYCLTPLRVAFDPVYRERAESTRSGLHRAALGAGISVFRAIDRAAWKHYSYVFWVSDEARRRAEAGGLKPSGPTEMLRPGLGIYGKPGGPSEAFFLIAGRIMWTKNIELGIEAFLRFREAYPGFRLVIAGMVDGKSESYLERLKGMAGGARDIEFIPAPSDEQLRSLYSRCFALLFTPFNEDWGIVPLEAMSFGKPVIAVNRGGPSESIEHEKSGILTAPEPEAFASWMGRLITDTGLANRLADEGPRSVAKYSWANVVERIDTVLEEIVKNQKLVSPNGGGESLS